MLTAVAENPKYSVPPINPQFDPDQYSTNPKTAKARAKRQGLQGYEVELARKQTADRKAKHIALSRLRGSAGYRDASSETKKELEELEIEELEKTRADKGISGKCHSSVMLKGIAPVLPVGLAECFIAEHDRLVAAVRAEDQATEAKLAVEALKIAKVRLIRPDIYKRI